MSVVPSVREIREAARHHSEDPIDAVLASIKQSYCHTPEYRKPDELSELSKLPREERMKYYIF